MLCITPTAATVIRSLTREAELPEPAGLRLTRDLEHRSLSMALAPRAARGDLTVFARDARVFVDAELEAQLDELTLDADIHDGSRRFFLHE